MNKTQLTDVISERANISITQAQGVPDAITQGIEQALEQGDDVALVGFGTFKVTERSSFYCSAALDVLAIARRA
jgi:DNA-binding protein HU-beta